MPAEKLNVQSGHTTPVMDEKNNDRIMTTSDDSVQRVTDQFGTTSLTSSKTPTGDHHSECPECQGEYDSCQHWTQVSRSFSSRHGQRKKAKNLPNGHMDDVRTVPNRLAAREPMTYQRPTNGEPNSRPGLRGSAEYGSTNINRTRSERIATHVVELNKINRSDASSPSPSAPSPEMKSDYDAYDNRSFHRYSVRTRRSIRPGISHSDSADLANTTPTNTDSHDPGPNTRPPYNRGSSNTSQSSSAQSNYRNGLGDNWRRPSNGTFRRSHHQTSYNSRNYNPYRPNASGPHPSRQMQNGFVRNRGSRAPDTGDSHFQPQQQQQQQQHLNPTDSCANTPSVVSPAKPSATTTAQEMKTSWAAAVAAPLKADATKQEQAANANHQQLVNFLVNQWHAFHRKSP